MAYIYRSPLYMQPLLKFPKHEISAFQFNELSNSPIFIDFEEKKPSEFMLNSQGKVLRKYSFDELSDFVKPHDPIYYFRNLESANFFWTPASRVRVNPMEVDFVDRKNPGIDLAGSFGTYFGLLHAHTSDSDGIGKPEDAFRVAKEIAKLDFFAVTDHSEYGVVSHPNAWSQLKSLAHASTRNQFVALAGFEYSNVSMGHYVVLNSEEIVSSLQLSHLDDFYRWLSLHDKAISIFAHPGYHGYRKPWDLAHFSFLPELKNRIIGIETVHMNVFSSSLRGFDKKIPYLDEAVAQGWRLGSVASQDVHHGNWGVRDSSRIGIHLESLSTESLLAGIKARRFYATQNENLLFSVNLQKRNGSWAAMGEEVSLQDLPEKSAPVRVRYADADGNLEPGKLEVVVNGKVVGEKIVTPQQAREKPRLFDFLFFNPLPFPLSSPRKSPIAGEFSFELPLPLNLQKGQVMSIYVRFYQGGYWDWATQSSPIYIGGPL
jgi:hypothetical protein